MDQVIKSVASDINDSQSVVNLEYDQYEKGLHIIYCTILDASYSGSLSGVSAILAAKKPDGTYIYNSCTIDGKTIKVPITEQMTASPGPYIADLIINNSGVRETVQKFRLTIRAAAVQDTEITSSSEYTALKSIDSTVLDTVQSYIDTKYATEYTLAELQSAQADCNAAMQTFPTANTGTEGQFLKKAASGNAVWADDLENKFNLFNNTYFPNNSTGISWYQETQTAHTIEVVSDPATASGRALKITFTESGKSGLILTGIGCFNDTTLSSGMNFTQSVKVKSTQSISVEVGYRACNSKIVTLTADEYKEITISGNIQQSKVGKSANWNAVFFANENVPAGTVLYIADYMLSRGKEIKPWNYSKEDYPLICNPIGTILPRSVNTNPGTDIGGTWVAVTGYPDGTYAFKRTA